MATMTTILLLLVISSLTYTSPVPSSPRHDPSTLWARGALHRQADAAAADRGQVTSGTAGYEAIGMCKATCVRQMLSWPPSDAQCSQNDQCVTCWQMCDHLYQASNKWRRACFDKKCVFGCSVACSFDFDSAQTILPERWEFPQPPVTKELGRHALVMSWSRPHHAEATPTEAMATPMVEVSSDFIVYTVMFKDDKHPFWNKAISTVNQMADITGDHTSLPGLEFLLLASTSRGTVAMTSIPYPGIPQPGYDDVTDLMETPEPVTPSTTTATTTTAASTPLPQVAPAEPIIHHWDPSMFTDNTRDNAPKPRTGSDLFTDEANLPGLVASLSVYVTLRHDGRLDTHVTWEQTLQRPLPMTYRVRWVRASCDVSPAAPPCGMGEEEVSAEIDAREGNEMELKITELTYNSQYTIFVSLSDAAPHHVTFFTPPCANPRQGFTLCPANIVAAPTTNTASRTPPATSRTPPATSRAPPAARHAPPAASHAPSAAMEEEVAWRKLLKSHRTKNPNRHHHKHQNKEQWTEDDKSDLLLKAALIACAVPLFIVIILLVCHYCRTGAAFNKPMLSSGNPGFHPSSSQVYASVDAGLNVSIPQPPPLPPLPPLTTPITTTDHAPPSATSAATAAVAAPRMGTRMSLTENPMRQYWTLTPLPSHGLREAELKPPGAISHYDMGAVSQSLSECIAVLDLTRNESS